jgi:cellulose synthase/poly-beta-1,6-N-acetylglucosamine synthase-like glycosyltransferase
MSRFIDKQKKILKLLLPFFFIDQLLVNGEKKRNSAPTKFENIFGKVLILLGFISSFVFIAWLLDPEFAGYKPLYYALIITFIYKILRLFIEWVMCFHLTVNEKPVSGKEWRVDVLTTYCYPEPKEMVINTLQAIQQITYPHKTFLCDESDDEELKKICKELNVTHVTRTEKKNAKAGNINNALNTVANGEICLILDPDHIPYPDFLDEVLPYFEDEKVGFVQVPQLYYNQENTIIAKAAAQQTYQYYGPFMMGLNTYGAVPAIGANCTFRREALDSIGGHAPGLTEDMHTAMLLHAKKWKSVYNPVIVAKGLVPWNYSGYCIQQLKWSRGSFDLLFRVIPKIFKNLSWKQVLNYFTPPFFYLSGIIAILDFLIPIIALFSGVVPIKISLLTFFEFYIPLLIMIIAIRQFNQKWLLEKHEKGAFIFGGTLFKAAWWSTMLGFIYTLINKKVPYIPTPKDSRYETPLKLLIPNFIIIIISLFAIVYGLNKDFNPFNIFMAVLAGINIAVLLLGSVMASQHLILAIHGILRNTPISKGSKTRKWIYLQKQKIYVVLQNSGVALLILTVFSLIAISHFQTKRMNNLKLGTKTSSTRFIPDLIGLPSDNVSPNAHFLYQNFDLDSTFFQKSTAFADSCNTNGKMPLFLIYLNPKQIEDSLKTNNSIFVDFFKHLRKNYSPVLISISSNDSLSLEDRYKLAAKFNEIIVLANQVSFPNITWVWKTNSPYNDPTIEYNKYSISWLLTHTSNLNYETAAKYSEKPIFSYDGNKIHTYSEPKKRLKDFDLKVFNTRGNQIASNKVLNKTIVPKEYIKGIVYNPGHDWRDSRNTVPLTISKVETDFGKIKSMGANTIRRYSPSIYDRNILKAANDKGLKVLYGFWFDPKVDYATQKFKLWRYEREVVKTVRKHVNNPAILGWTVGNETWGLLKLYFAEPYLSIVRMHYIKMISNLAAKIREIDPKRPIFVAEEHTPHLSSAVYAFSNFAPEIDFFGINSYYLQNISILDSIMFNTNPDKPYLVSEFGPKGYWHKEYNDYIYDTLLYEQNSFSKAENFIYQWENYIYKHKSRNLGGIAFCWQDRYEGTATWFGLTDLYGNRKPSWNALKYCFTNDSASKQFSIPIFHIFLSRNYLYPKKYATARAATRENEIRNSLYFKWIIYEEGNFNKIEESSFIQGGFEYRFKVPAKKSKYRIYLYVSDNKGNVVTESSPLIIKWKE